MLTNVNENVAPHVTSRIPGTPNHAGALAFLFGAARREELSGVALTRLMGTLGVGPSAVRTLLSRMRQAGDLTSTRRGRQVDYRLAGRFAAGFRRIQAGPERTTPEWDGSFHTLLYHVPERRRAFRDALRRTAQLQGYGLLQQGVLIAIEDRSAHLAEVLDRCPRDARVQRARLTLAPPDAAHAAAIAWDLPGLAAAYRDHIDRLRAAVAREDRPPADGDTLARLAALTTAPMVDTLGDPGLPAALLPGDWPLPELLRAIGRVHEIYGPPAAAYVERVIAACGR